MKMKGMKCSHCGSMNVGADLASEWDRVAQGWESCGDLDGWQCHDCGEEDCVEKYELHGQELAEVMQARRMCGIDKLLMHLVEVTKDDGAIGALVLSEASSMAYAIRAKLAMYAATMAEHDRLVDALALTLPYAETRAADLLDAKLNNEPEYGPGFIEDENCPGADEAASVVEHAGRVLARYGKKSRLLERGQRAGGVE